MTDYNAIRGAARRVLPVVLGVGALVAPARGAPPSPRGGGALAAPGPTEGAGREGAPPAWESGSGTRTPAKPAVGTGYRFGVYGTAPRHADIVLQGKWRNGPWRYWGRT